MRKVTACLTLLCASAVCAQGPTPDGTWIILNEMPADVAAQEPWVRPDRFTAMVLNHTQMAAALQAAPDEKMPGVWNEALFFWLPDPNGNIQCFQILESSIMEPELQAQFPEIRTYVGQGVTDPNASVRIDFTDPSAQWNGAGGFHAQVLSVNGNWYIDPYSRGNFNYYTSHYKKDLRNTHPFSCAVEEEFVHAAPLDEGDDVSIARSGTTLRTYRLSNAATGEYTTFHGGTVAAGQNAIVVAVNRVTGVYEVEQAVRLTLIGTNSANVFTNSGTDPYTNSNGSTMLGENQTRMNTTPGSANYDIGHVFSTGGGGVAGLGVVCSSANKARGVTGLPSPTGDAFYIDFVAHEMGHQFGGNHTFNSPSGNCAGGNRSASSAYEPGSGSTIMAYAGICAPDDIQSNSDAYMHSRSFDEILTFTNTGGGNGCAVQTATGNVAPTVSAGAAKTIPINTPFVLTATGSDANGDPLTYCWEQRSLGAALTLAGADNGTSPLFRSLPATSSPSRLFPKLATVLSGAVDNKEKMPVLARTMVMRVTARDNRAGGGGVNTSDVTITVNGTSGPFLITSQNSAVSYPGGSSQAVTWSVNNTTAAPVSCANVMIEWSTNNGGAWSTLIASTPNDGSENITIPATLTSLGRVRVSAVGNIFFDINNAPIQVTAGVPAAPSNVVASPDPVCAGTTINLSGTVGAGETIDWYANVCSGLPFASGLSVNRIANATTTYFAKARHTSSGMQSATCTSVTSTVVAQPVAPTSASTDRNNFCTTDSGNILLSASGGSGTTARWFSDSCGGTSIGTGTSLSIPSPVATTTYFVRWENQCALTSCQSVTVTVLEQAADFNQDGNVDFFDYLDFVDAYSANDPSADFNGDSAIDFFDYLDFVDAYSLGGC